LASLGHVAEGVLCAAAVGELAKRLNVEMPITAMMDEVLAGRLEPKEAVKKLMGRDPKIEA
jgi:glycerol-3-phosphate dehydrogenase (NAD(P)+)